MILQQSQATKSHERTAGLPDSPAPIFRVPTETATVSSESEADYFSKLLDYSKAKVPLLTIGQYINPDGLSLKMLNHFCQSTADSTSRRFCISWGKSGIVANVIVSIQKHMYPNTASGFTLSDIFEQNVEEKYFLSEAQTRKLLSKS